jgi:hypothetical protein
MSSKGVGGHIFHDIGGELIKMRQLFVGNLGRALPQAVMNHGPLLFEHRLHHQPHLFVNIHGVEELHDVFAGGGDIAGCLGKQRGQAQR